MEENSYRKFFLRCGAGVEAKACQAAPALIMPFYAPGFDPLLIVSQIAAMQALLYLNLGLWLLVLNGLAGSNLSSIGLRHLFSPDSISISYAGGWVTILALFLNAVAGQAPHCCPHPS